MLSELRRLVEKSEDYLEADFRKAAADLLGQQFLFADAPRQRRSYQIVSRHFDYYQKLFDALGWELRFDREFGYLGLVPGEGQSYLPLKQDETLTLLLLRLMYEEGLEQFQAEQGRVKVAAEELLQRYELLLKRERPQKTRFLEILQLFKRQNLVALGEESSEQPLPPIHVLPSVRAVTGQMVLERLEAFAESEEAQA